jgi:two-component system, cell cycle response regulator DivK
MSKRILVVEDQEDLRGLLSGSGYTVLEAADGQAGVAKALSERPDLILMDIQLPVLDGPRARSRTVPTTRKHQSSPSAHSP